SAVPQLPASMFAPRTGASALTVGGVCDRLAKETRGVVVPSAVGENLTAPFRRILDEVRSSYVLYYTPRNGDRPGVPTLDVRVKRPGVDARARSHYVWR